MIHHVTRATKHLIFWSLILTAIVLTGVRLALKGVENYKSHLETRIAAMVGTPVKVGHLGANMRGISPELVVRDINFAPLAPAQGDALHFQEIRFGVDLGKFLLYRDALLSSSVTVVGAKLAIYRKPDGEFAIEGLKAGKGQPLWLLQGRKYELLQSQVTWQDKLKQAAPVILESVNVAVMNNGNHHRINALAKTPESLGGGITAILDFKGDIKKPKDITGTIYVKADQLKLKELLSPYLPLGLGLGKGIGDIKAWGHWQNGGFTSVETETRLQDAVLSRKGKGSLAVSSLDTQFKWHVDDQQWQFDLHRFLLETSENGKKANKKWPDAALSMAGEIAAGTMPNTIKFYAKQLELAEFAKFAQFFAPDDQDLPTQIKLLGESQLSGMLNDFAVFAQPEKGSFAVAGGFNAVSFAPREAVPGLGNLSGQIKGSEDMGQITLASKNGNFIAPKLFANPLKLDRIDGIVGWRQTETQWRLASQSITVDCPAFQGESRIRVELPKTDEKSFLDVQIALRSNDVSQAAAYMPTQIMNEKNKRWLTNAFVSGKVNKADLLIYGKISDFPYTDGSGVFEGKLDIVDGALNYHPDWPKISGIKGTVSFAQNTISGNFNHGFIDKFTINKADMLISGIGSDDLLSIKSEGQGELNQGLAVLKNSPLADKIKPLLTGLTVQGQTKVYLDLGIPLRAGSTHELKVDGKVQLNNDQMTVNRMGLEINSINGDLKFNKEGIYGEKIKGVALGNPIQANIIQEDRQTLVDVTGKARVDAIQNLFHLPVSQAAEGEAEYLLELKTPKVVDDNNPFALSVKSTLEGVALNVPGLLVKTKEQQKPTVLTVSLSDQETLPIELDYNNQLKAAISLNAKEGKINSGHILLGKGDVKQRKQPGIKLEISQEPLALQDWLGMAANQKAGTPALPVNEIKIHSGSAYWQKTRLGAFEVNLKRNDNDWVGDIDSAFGKGKFQIPHETSGVSPVTLDMETMNLTALKQLKLQEGTMARSDFKPLINISSKKTLWQSENLGNLALQTERTPNGIKIKRLELVGDDEKLFMTGNWKETGIKSITHVTGRLEMKKADELFDRLNITKDLTGTSGKIDFKLYWHAMPWHVSLLTLAGSMDVKLLEGRILSIEPGFGRVLGILAVEQWIKRLQLDFSDIYEEGLTFNSIKGHFDVVNGNAQSKGLVIDAVPAKITIIGDTNLVNQTVDQVIKVVPKSLDAVPIAGTIVSKMAAMVGKTLTGKDQEGFLFGKEYLVKGNWNDIKVSASHQNDGLVTKTWRSITDFPWNDEK